MSVSAEVQRTLVKSPPELWAELSSPESLAKHLGELGDIRITAVEPESKVEWEAEGATGVVELKQSGWGTKVTLSLTRPTPGAEAETAAEAETEPDAMTATGIEAGPESEDVAATIAAIAEPASVLETVDTAAEPAPAVEPVATIIEPEPAPDPLSAPEPRLGFFARLFRKRKTKPAAAVEPQSEPAPEPELERVEVEVVAMAAPEPIYPEPPPEPVVDLAAELASVEAQMSQESTELLTGVLDRLGAAHHRPFSRG
jgi:hypothetical protein